MKQDIINQYVIDMKPIGQGLYGAVYRGYDSINERTVAIKVTSNLKRASREAKVMQRYAKSDYLPVLYDYFRKENIAYIVMEFIGGKPLGKEFDDYGEIYDEKCSVEIVIHILRGLHILHKSGYFHRDIKPKNIMILENNPTKIKIIDFNVTKLIKDEDSIQHDLRHAARMYIYLTNGIAQKSIKNAAIKNHELKAVILKAFNPKTIGRFKSAKEFINALRAFG